MPAIWLSTAARVSPRRRPRNWRRGFTLIELLVVVGLIAVLISILLPALTKARNEAKRAKCAAQLHQILVGCGAYLIDYEQYPCNYVNDRYGMIYPHDQQSRTLNELMGYVGTFPAITDATLSQDLPAALVCPFVEPDATGTKWVGNGNTYWYTGYGYFAGLDEQQNYPGHTQNGMVRLIDHVANRRGTRRGVVWGDATVWFGSANMWYYSHLTRSVAFNPGYTFWHESPDACAGRHLAYSDGSVAWDAVPNLQTSTFTDTVAYWGPDYYWWF